jgi:hypothetical protein
MIAKSAADLPVRIPTAAVHVASLLELFAHSECRRQRVRRMAAFHDIQVDA